HASRHTASDTRYLCRVRALPSRLSVWPVGYLALRLSAARVHRNFRFPFAYVRPVFDIFCFFFSSRRRHTRSKRDWSSDVCSSDLDCGCGSPGGERAAAALKEFAESFQERNPHLRVFNMVLHMDEATPHLHVDFVPVAMEQSRGLSTRVSMKQALKQQGFEGLGRKQTEWKAWMEREKEALTEIAQAHEFEIISLGGGRPHMELPEYRAAAQRLEAVQEQVIAAEQEIAALEKQRKALQGNVKLLKAVEKVKPDLDAIQPEKTLTGAVKGVTVEQVKELKAAVIRGAAAEQKVRELKVENQQLQQKIPSTKEKLKEAQERQRLENENRQLKVQVEYLEEDLSRARGFSARLQEGIGAVLDFLDRHLPEQFRPMVEKARELLPVPEVQQPEKEQQRGHTWGGMER